VLIYVRSPDTALVVAEFLRKKLNLSQKEAHQRIGLLTGTLRGYERDKLAESDLFRAFASDPKRRRQLEQTLYLVSTSAGEVGVDLDADHLVCDLTTLDSMIQRLGRVNRLGGKDRAAEVMVVCDAERKKEESDEKKAQKTSVLDDTVTRTREILQSIETDGGNVSPDALRRVLESQGVEKAFSPVPKILPATDILFDTWALTTIRDKLPGRPPVEPYLHGISEWEPPETYVAWREEVGLVTRDLLERYKPDDLLDDYPLKPHELLRHYTHRVVTELEGLTTRLTDCNASKELFAWVIDGDGTVEIHPLPRLVERDKQKKPLVNLSGRTVVLSPAAGGLSEQGMLKGASPFIEERRGDYDVADEWRDEEDKPRRIRVESDDAWPKPPHGMRWLRTIDMRPNDEGDSGSSPGESSLPAKLRYWHWYEVPRSSESEGSKSSQEPIQWQTHTNHVTDNATRIARALNLPDDLEEAVRVAAKCHDSGKKRGVWQRSIGNTDYPNHVYAKSGKRMKPIEITRYRHEFGSLIDTQVQLKSQKQSTDVKDLILHLIAASHGRARPDFPPDGAFDPEPKDKDVSKIAVEVVQRFARLERKYGRWGLAYLESLLRAADYAASANPSAFKEKEQGASHDHV
jgi:CRISPR-associated endonuclease/helicase Cas3